MGVVLGGDNGRALDLQIMQMQRLVNSIPVAGHIKGGVHYALGQNEQGHEAMKASSRSTGVMIGGVGGFAVAGPIGAVAGGIAGGATVDGIITGSEYVINGEYKPHGYFAIGHEVKKAIDGERKITFAEGFDMAMLPVWDGFLGYSAANVFAEHFGLNVPGDKPGAAVLDHVSDNANVIPKRPNGLGLCKKALDNRANQLNPNHQISGPGRWAGYAGSGTKFDLNNHANQLNPNNIAFKVSPEWWGGPALSACRH